MTHRNAIGRALALVFGAPLVFGACDDADLFLAKNQVGQPAGALDGTVTYSGPLPCTAGGHVVGAANLLVLDVRLLPPPDGLGRGATSLTVVGGDTLFESIRPSLKFNPDGSRWCPEPGSSVTVSAPWSVGPLAAGAYQVRGFYDRDGNFDPSFSISNLPSFGDVSGGAIENAAEVLTGRKPRYRILPLGEQTSPGVWRMWPNGARIGEVAVSLALPMPTERPIFYPEAVLAPQTAPNGNPLHVTMPADFQLAKFDFADPPALEQSFVRLRLFAGVAPPEVDAATKSPFFLPVAGNPTLIYTREDVDGNGIIDKEDHVPDSDLIPSLYPMAVFSKRPKTPSRVVTGPLVVLQGLTIYKDIVSTTRVPANLREPRPEAIVALRPATVCLDPLDSAKPGALVVSHRTDKAGNPIVRDEARLKAALTAKFQRPMDVVYGCLPVGDYAMNLVYPTGQAWTLPNEAGECAPSEPGTADRCGSRARLVSQNAKLTIAPGADGNYCSANPTPAVCGQ